MLVFCSKFAVSNVLVVRHQKDVPASEIGGKFCVKRTWASLTPVSSRGNRLKLYAVPEQVMSIRSLFLID